MKTTALRFSVVTLLALSVIGGTCLFAADPAGSETPLPLPARKPAVRGVLPDGPLYNPTRLKPAINPTTGKQESPLDLDTLMTPPDATFGVPQRRNNFYKLDRNTDGLYRFAASGHFSNYKEDPTNAWMKSVPDVLKMLNGKMVTDAETWRTVRRPEVVRIMEYYMFGKVPSTAPKVVWTAGELVDNGDGTKSRTATGRFVNADGTPWVNPPGAGRGAGAPPAQGTMIDGEEMWFAAAPAGPAAPGAPGAARGAGAARGGRGGVGGGRGGGGAGGLTVTYTIPANATGRVPLIRGGNLQQALAMGFGVVNFGGGAPNVTSNPPADDDWGAIRKTAWVVSKGLDYLETDKYADAQIALTGHSIGGKQALMAAVFDERVAVCFASCSGLGGAQMARHDMGETIDDVAQLSAENYCKNLQYWVSHYDEMPFDSHFLVALVAPRALLITGGTQDLWSDPVGVFWAGHYASSVYKLFGEKGLIDDKGVEAVAPPAPNAFLGGKLFFEEHVGGHMPMANENAKYAEMQKTFMKIKPFGTEKPAAQ